MLHVLEASLGGTRRYLENIVAASAAMPMRFGLVHSSLRADRPFAAVLENARRQGWALVQLDMLRQIRPTRDLHDALALRRIVARLRPRILHAHSSKAGALARIAVATLRHKPALLYSPHALPVDLGVRYLLIERGLSAVATRFVAVSDSEREQIAHAGLAPFDAIDVVAPTVDAGYFAPRDRGVERSALGFPAVPLIVGIGRMTAQKRPLDFVQLVARLRRTRPTLRALWVGGGDLESDFDAASRDAELTEALERVAWSDDIRPYVASADVVVSTAGFESFGFVVAEAMSMERPVVASRVTGTTDVLGGFAHECSFTVGEIDEAAVRVERFLNDDGVARAFGRATRRSIVERFSTSRMTAALAALYR